MMVDFSFLAIPTIEGMRLWRYIQIFGSVVLFGICLFFVVYWLLKRRIHYKLSRQYDDVVLQSHTFTQQVLIRNIIATSGKTKLVLFIEYMERFVTIVSTDAQPISITIPILLWSCQFTAQELQTIEHVLYAHWHLSSVIETKINRYFDTIIPQR